MTAQGLGRIFYFVFSCLLQCSEVICTLTLSAEPEKPWAQLYTHLALQATQG